MKTDDTSKRLFFQVLKVARRLKREVPYSPRNRAFLFGMLHAMKTNREDFTIADNMRDVWANWNSGAEGVEE